MRLGSDLQDLGSTAQVPSEYPIQYCHHGVPVTPGELTHTVLQGQGDFLGEVGRAVWGILGLGQSFLLSLTCPRPQSNLQPLTYEQGSRV